MIGTGIVDQNDFVVIPLAHCLTDRTNGRLDVILLVEAGNNEAEHRWGGCHFCAIPTTCKPALCRPGSARITSSACANARVIARIPGTNLKRRLKNRTSLFMNRQKPRKPCVW